LLRRSDRSASHYFPEVIVPMRHALLATLATTAFLVAPTRLSAAQRTQKDDAKSASKETAASEMTRTKLLKAKVGGAFKNARIGDILKEFAAQVEMSTDHPVLWNYGPGFPFAKKINFTAKDLPMESALDDLLKQAGDGLGYVVVAKEGDKYDGWVQLTTTGERGNELPPPTAAEESAAAERLALAKKLVDAGKSESAKPLLQVLIKKYAATKAGMEAKGLLEKLNK
jgi:hypothetical protein